MSFFLLALTLSATALLLISAMLFYIRTVPANQAGTLEWAVGFLLLAIAYLVLIFLAPHVAVSDTEFIHVILVILYSVFLVMGVVRHFEHDQRVAPWIFSACITVLWFGYFFSIKEAFMTATVVPALFLAATHFYSSFLFYRAREQSKGFLFIAVLIGLMAIHYADYPFLRQVEWFAPWGFLISGLLSIGFSCGLLLVKFHDFKTEMLDAKELALKLAHHDSLTGIENRRRLVESFEILSELAARRSAQLIVAYIDLNDFKQINDLYGHEAGDYTLVKVARRLKDAVRDSDVVARVGGDEFVVLANDCETQSAINELMERIRHRLKQPVIINQESRFIDASIGYSVFPRDGRTLEQLLSYADKQMFDEKVTRRKPAV